MSQKQAAIEAVQRIGLNQIKNIEPSWFDDKKLQTCSLQDLIS